MLIPSQPTLSSLPSDHSIKNKIVHYYNIDPTIRFCQSPISRPEANNATACLAPIGDVFQQIVTVTCNGIRCFCCHNDRCCLVSLTGSDVHFCSRKSWCFFCYQVGAFLVWILINWFEWKKTGLACAVFRLFSLTCNWPVLQWLRVCLQSHSQPLMGREGVR